MKLVTLAQAGEIPGFRGVLHALMLLLSDCCKPNIPPRCMNCFCWIIYVFHRCVARLQLGHECKARFMWGVPTPYCLVHGLLDGLVLVGHLRC